MKAEVTLTPIADNTGRYVCAAANLAGGLAPKIANPALYPTEENNNTYPR